jgi:hypothetical protein
MKNKLSILVAGMFLLSQAAMAQTTTTFNLSATVPMAASIGVTVSQVNSSSNVFTTMPAGTVNLPFGSLTFTTTGTPPINVYLPSVYYAIDLAATNGAGSPDVTVTYTEGLNPNGASNGLGTKTAATFVKETFTSASTPPSETPLVDQGPNGKKVVSSLSAQHVPFTDTTGGWLRIYLGICSGAGTDPSGCSPFSNADAAGNYAGSLAVTTTVN